MDKLTKKILRNDSISESEKMIGKNWQEFNDEENMATLGFNYLNNKIKDTYLSSLGDTHFNMSWKEFKQLIIGRGFVSAMEYDIHHDDNEIDEFVIYYHPKKGLIVCATSYWNKTNVNGGELYGEIQANSKDDIDIIYKWLSSGGCIDKDKMIFSTSHDVREGLFSKLDELESAGRFLPRWTERNRFLWFVDYKEDKVKGYDYKKITNKKLLKCPKELREIVGI
jgi:hypothetical protein